MCKLADPSVELNVRSRRLDADHHALAECGVKHERSDGELDGVYNVAPDGWIPGERVRALTGDRLRLPLPERLREVVSALRWRFQRGPIPPGLGPYTREPWVVANDKLRSAGWTPTVTNEQTYVEGTESRWWTMVTPKRRQELSLGAMVGVIAAVSIVGFSLVRRSVRRRRARRLV